MTLYSNHAFPRHSHDQFGIGVMTAGAQRSWSVVGQVEAQVGDVIMCNPGEMHDGMPLKPGTGSREPNNARGWRILYFDPSFIENDIRTESNAEMIVAPVVRDRRLAAQVAQLFRLVDRDVSDPLAVEECLVRCLMDVSHRHRLSARVPGGTSPPVTNAVQRLDDQPEVAISLAQLARLSGVSRFQLLRGFAREVGVTPHAYAIQRRALLARRYLASGKSPLDAALLAGFADQSHMTRAFVRCFGVTPARYRAALR